MDLTDRVPPLSFSALLTALAAVVIATALRALAGFAGEDLRLAAYCPAVLATGLVAGVPAAIFVAILSAVSAAFLFVPPYFEFEWLTAEQASAFLVYGVATALTILFAHWCRLVIARAKEQQKAYEKVAKELAHRSRNSTAVIQAIIHKTLNDQPDRAEKILGRVRAAQFGNELLIREQAQIASLHALLAHELERFGEARVQMRGPVLELSADQARQLIMLFHELATNAAKYGSLCVSAGRLNITWRIDDGTVTLLWSELSGPIVSTPDQNGFGSTLITQCVRGLRGTFECDYVPDGFSCVEISCSKG